MSITRRILTATASLSLVISGTVVAGAPSASAAGTVRWLSIDPGTTAGVYTRSMNYPSFRTYFVYGAFLPTAGCTYRARRAYTGTGFSLNYPPSYTQKADGAFGVSWSFHVSSTASGYLQAVMYVVGKCDDGTYEMGNVQWYRQADGTEDSGPIPPLGPIDAADAERTWNEGAWTARTS